MSHSPQVPPVHEHVAPLADAAGTPSVAPRSLSVRERDPGVGGRPFLLVHGLASNARLWDGVAAVLAAAGHRVVAVDQRGHGRSDRAPDGYGYPEVTGDLVALARAMGLDHPVLVGQSWGGNVVLHAAALHPGEWHAVAAVDGGTIDLTADFADAQTAWDALRPPLLAGRPAAEVQEMIADSVAGWPEGAVDAQMANFRTHPDGTISPRLVLADHRQVVEAMFAGPPSGVLPAIDVPVLLLPVRGGSTAWALRKQAAVDDALAVLPRGRVQWFDGAHDIHLQDPEGVAEALLTLV